MVGSASVPVRKAVMDGLAIHYATTAGFDQGALEHEVECTYAYDFGSSAAERVYSGASRGDTPPAALRSGRNHRDERATFEVNVAVMFLGGDGYDADARVGEIGAEFEEWIADRKSNELEVTGLNSLFVSSWVADYMKIDAGMASVRTYTVTYTARLT